MLALQYAQTKSIDSSGLNDPCLNIKASLLLSSICTLYVMITGDYTLFLRISFIKPKQQQKKKKCLIDCACHMYFILTYNLFINVPYNITVQIRCFEYIANSLIVVGLVCWPVLRYADNPVLFGDDHSRIHHILETLDLTQQDGLSCLRTGMDLCRHGAVVSPSPESSLGSITRWAQVDYQTCRGSGMLQVSWLALAARAGHSQTRSLCHVH